MKVRRFFLRLLPRLGIFVLSVLLLSVLTFYISRLAPGDPLVSYYGDRVEKMSPAEREWAEDKLGLNDPLPTQYARWFSRALHGDFGISYKYKIDVLELIGDRIGNTLLLGGLGFVLLFVLALLLGALCAWKEDRPLDRILCKLGTVTSCIPEFWLSLMLILLFSVTLRWLPSSGAYSVGHADDVGDRIVHLLLPMSVVVLSHLWYYAYLVRNRLVEELRVIKDADEIKALERSFALNHAMLRWLEESQLQPGRSEAELAWAIEKYFRDNGASELAFPSIVAVDQNAALPHAIPGEKKLPDNGLVLVDVGCRVDGYCSDQTRTFWVGDAPHKEFRETMKLVRDAQQAALDKMRPGLPLHEAYTLARGVFEKAGVEAWFTHGLGHGVGLETHEAPSLGRRGDKVLQEGMVVTVEPGLYYPQWGGIRWEYTVLITADGNRIL